MTHLKVDSNGIIDFLKQLIRTNSVNPHIEEGPGETEISELIACYLDSIGLDVQMQDVIDGRRNIVGLLRGHGNAPTLMLNGHTDTVGIEGMTIDPFDPVIKGNLIFGRGACDMKGPLASMIGAVKAIVDSRIALNGDLLISAVVDEEWASAGTEKLIEKYRADAVVVGEPTGGHVGVAHKGFVCLEIRVYGEAAHGSLSDTLGVNAVEMSAEILSKLRDLRRHYANKRHKLFGAPSIYAYFIQGGTNCSIVPDSCVIRVEKRTISSEDGIEAMNEIEAILKEPPLRKLGFRTDVVQLYERPPLDTSHNEPIVSSLLYAARLTLKNRPRVIGRPYWTDAALFSNKAHIPACLFGPGDLSRGHSSRECIDIREIINAAGAYALAATRFCGCWHQIKRNRIKTERTITAPIALA